MHPINAVFLSTLFARPSQGWFLAMAAVELWALFPRKAFNEDALFALSAQTESVLFGETEGVVALILALAVVLVRPAQRDSFFQKLPVAAFGVLGLVPLAAALGAGALGVVPSAVIAILGGLTKTSLIILCASLYCRLETPRAISYVLLSFAAAGILRLPLELLPPRAVCVVAVPMPFVCAFMCKRGFALLGKDGAAGQLARPASQAPVSPSLPSYLVLLAAFSFVLGSFWLVVEPRLDASASVLMVCVQILVPIAFWALLLKTYQTINLGFIFQLVLVLVMSAALFASSADPGQSGQVAPVAAYLARYFLKMITITVLIALAQQTNAHPIAFFGLGYGVFLVSLTTGIGLQPLLEAGTRPASSPLLLMLVLTVVTTAVLVANMYRQRDSQLFSPYRPQGQGAPDPDVPSRRSLVVGRCAELAQDADLTKREHEVMELIGLGHSKGYIAEDLGLSENTVRSYAKSLYRKLGIHSRQELLELIDRT